MMTVSAEKVTTLAPLEPNCTRIVLEGLTSFSIQGRGLREWIEKVVNGADKESQPMNLKGRVKNLKDGRVEIICFGPDVDKLFEVLEKRKAESAKDQLFIKRCERSEFFDPDITTMTDFKTERSDDSSEMIWALRGAGDRFAESTKELRNLTTGLETVHHDILERDKKSATGRLLTLHYELISNRDRLADTHARGVRPLPALQANIEWPAIPEQEFAHLVSQVYLGLQDSEVDTAELKGDIDTLLDMVDRKLSEFGVNI